MIMMIMMITRALMMGNDSKILVAINNFSLVDLAEVMITILLSMMMIKRVMMIMMMMVMISGGGL